MNIQHELGKELILMLGDAGELPYPVLEGRALQSVQRMYSSEEHLETNAVNDDLFHAVFFNLRRNEGVIARRVERGRPLYSLTQEGRERYHQLDAVYRTDVADAVLVA